jgi:HEAT repeat protein
MDPTFEGRSAMKSKMRVRVLAAVMMVALVAVSSLAVAEEKAQAQKPVDQAQVAAKIMPMLKSDNPEVRAAMARLLGEVCCKEAVEALVTVMKTDEAAGVRMVAANALAKSKDYRVIADMREQAKQDQSKTVRTVLNAIADEMEREKNLASS